MNNLVNFFDICIIWLYPIPQVLVLNCSICIELLLNIQKLWLNNVYMIFISVGLSYSNQICGAFFSTKATANLTSDTYVQPINIAVCVERVPLVTPSKSDLEKQFEDLQEQLELEHSSLSDYEISKAKMIKKREELKNDADNEKLKKEVAQLDSEYQVHSTEYAGASCASGVRKVSESQMGIEPATFCSI